MPHILGDRTPDTPQPVLAKASIDRERAISERQRSLAACPVHRADAEVTGPTSMGADGSFVHSESEPS
jgi:hypothetical protein